MRLLLAALLSVILATGCTHIPTAGPVEEVPVSAEPRGIDIAPQPPVAGMLPSRLVDGFLQAMASPEGDYSIARQYLTEDAAQRWEPTDAVVFDGLVVGGPATATLDATQLGTIDEHGRYSSEPGDLEHDFGVVSQGGEWRIDSPLPSLMVSRYIFERYYERVPLYFMSRSGTHVVPDPIHLPEMLVTPTAVVEALLNGPSEAVDQAVTDAMPSGISLADEGATIEQSGVVTVNLEGLFDRLGDDARRRLGAQLLWSLTAIPRVTGLVVTSDGVPFTLPGARADGALELASQQGYQILSRAATVDLFGIREGTPGRVTGDSRFEPWGTTVADAADLAVSLDGDTAALIDATRSTLLMGSMRGEFGEVAVPVTNLRSPQFVLGTLWLMGDDTEGVPRLLTVDRMGSVTEVKLSLPMGREARGLRGVARPGQGGPPAVRGGESDDGNRHRRACRRGGGRGLARPTDDGGLGRHGRRRDCARLARRDVDRGGRLRRGSEVGVRGRGRRFAGRGTGTLHRSCGGAHRHGPPRWWFDCAAHRRRRHVALRGADPMDKACRRDHGHRLRELSAPSTSCG